MYRLVEFAGNAGADARDGVLLIRTARDEFHAGRFIYPEASCKHHPSIGGLDIGVIEVIHLSQAHWHDDSLHRIITSTPTDSSG